MIQKGSFSTFFFGGAIVGSSGKGRGIYSFDVVYPAFLLPTVVLPAFQCALKDSSGKIPQGASQLRLDREKRMNDNTKQRAKTRATARSESSSVISVKYL